ncbi:MAG: hypothetical protein IKT59_04985 [Bacteroidales bacterium]|nr:hypothetical protein [Bacteroidales bacterium]
MKIIIRITAALAALAVLLGCPQVTPDGPELNQSLAFTLKVISVTGESARISVSHNGTDTDTWYGFASSDVNTNVATLISEKISELSAGGKITGLRKQSGVTINAGELEPETDYVYIVFGLTEDGTFYGNPASIEFKTGQDASKVTEVNTWTIQYQGRTTDESTGQVAENFSIQMAGKDRFYFTTVKKTVLEANEMTLEDYIKYEITYTIPNYLKYYKVTEFTFNESLVLSNSRMESGDYYGIAIGMKTDGTSTNTYSAAEFTIAEETAKADYTQWLGTWKVTSAEYEGQKRSYTINIEHYDNNYLYVISGWETNGDIDYNINEYVGEYVIPAVYVEGKLGFQEYTFDLLDFENDDKSYYFGFYGVGDVVYQGQSYSNQLCAFDGTAMGIAETTDNGVTGTITGLSASDESVSVTYKGMGYAAYSEDGQSLVAWNSPLYFPITMTKQASAFSAGIKPTLSKKLLKAEMAGARQGKPSVFKAR